MKLFKLLCLTSIVCSFLSACAANPDNPNAATVSGNYAPPKKSAAQTAGAMIAPVTH